jgi:hypothetical protein
MNVGGYRANTGCATLNVVCEAVAGAGLAASSSSVSPDPLEGDKIVENDDDVADGGPPATSSTVVAVAAVAVLVIAVGLIVARRRIQTSTASDANVDDKSPAVDDAAFPLSTPSHFYPQTSSLSEGTGNGFAI